MKVKLVVFFCILFFSGSSQTSLTNGAVYDYNIGDVFQTYSYGTGMSTLLPQYVTKEVLTKNYSSSLDTVFYSFKRTVYDPPLCGPCPGQTVVDTIYENYTNLTSAVNMQPFPIVLQDTIYLDFCNKNTWKMTTRSFPNGAGEYNQNEHYVVAGCGGLYFNRIVGIGGPASEHYNLVYYKKGGDECGTLTVNIIELGSQNSINIFPNPSNGMYSIQAKGNLFVFNTIGEKVFSQKLVNDTNLLDLSGFPNGMYFISLQTEEGVFVNQIVKQ